MENPSFQTVRLGRGAHASPEHGACVMELASMLAGEQFTDQPHAVCPVIAALMRAYNDGIDDTRRQDLYAYASACVGTRDRRARRARLARCMEFFGQRAAMPGVLLHSRIRSVALAAVAYARDADDAMHQRFLGLLDELTCRDEMQLPEREPAPRAA